MYVYLKKLIFAYDILQIKAKIKTMKKYRYFFN